MGLKIENQKLRDEVNLLKGEQGKPNVRGNKKGDQGNVSSESERKQREKKGERKPKTKKDKIKIDRSEICKVDQSELPDRCYSYLLQEIMDYLGIRDGFDESRATLEKVLGLKISSSRFERVTRDTSTSYNEFYEHKSPPPPESEGKFQVLSFDGKGVPVIKRELTELKARLGKGEKRQKKKEALVGVSYTVDKKDRSAEDVAKNLIYPDKNRNSHEQNKVKAQNQQPRL